MLRFLKFASFSLALAATAQVASAETITFATLTAPNGSTFTTYTQGSYTVTSQGGNVRVGQNFGDPVPDLFTEEGGSIEIQKTTGDDDFTFNSVDIGNSGDSAGNYTITGYLNGVQVFSDHGTIDYQGIFSTYGTGSDSSAINALYIQIASTGNGSGVSNIDNIALTAAASPAATPEPESFLLVGTGLLAVAARARRRLRL